MNYNQFTKPVRYAVLVGGLDSEQKLGVEETIHDFAEEFRERGFNVASVTKAIAGQLERVLAEVETLCQRREKLGIFDCCHAGIMKIYAGVDITILAASNEDNLAYGCRNINHKRRLSFGNDINRFMQRSPEQFCIGRLFDETEKNLIITGWQVPELRGDRAFQ